MSNGLIFLDMEEIIRYYESELCGMVYDMIDLIQNSNKYEYSDKPIKPKLKHPHTSSDVAVYANELIKYETELKAYEENLGKYQIERYRLNDLIEKFIREESGLNYIPVQYRDKVYSYAYSEGHSNGYYEVYNKLLSLVEIFK